MKSISVCTSVIMLQSEDEEQPVVEGTVQVQTGVCAHESWSAARLQ
jgi:hypothetical protein